MFCFSFYNLVDYCFLIICFVHHLLYSVYIWYILSVIWYFCLLSDIFFYYLLYFVYYLIFLSIICYNLSIIWYFCLLSVIFFLSTDMFCLISERFGLLLDVFCPSTDMFCLFSDISDIICLLSELSYLLILSISGYFCLRRIWIFCVFSLFFYFHYMLSVFW